jgi:hypothetical protein
LPRKGDGWLRMGDGRSGRQDGRLGLGIDGWKLGDVWRLSKGEGWLSKKYWWLGKMIHSLLSNGYGVASRHADGWLRKRDGWLNEY